MMNTMTAIYVQSTNCYIILLLIEKATVSIKAIMETQEEAAKAVCTWQKWFF